MTGTRKDTYRVTLSVNGRDWGVWQTKTGGKVGSDATVIYPGGMAPQKSLGGRKTVDLITLTRNYDLERDHGRFQELIDAAGSGQAVVKVQPLDPAGHAYGRPAVWTGKLQSAEHPEVDSASTEEALMTVEVQPDGDPTIL